MVDQGNQHINHTPPNNPGQPSVDQHMVKRVRDLFGEIDQVMNDLRVPQQDRAQVMQNLMQAVSVDLMTRLSVRMSDEEKEELVEMTKNVDMKSPNLQAVATFFRGKFTKEELMETLSQSMKSVLVEFVQEMTPQ